MQQVHSVRLVFIHSPRDGRLLCRLPFQLPHPLLAAMGAQVQGPQLFFVIPGQSFHFLLGVLRGCLQFVPLPLKLGQPCQLSA